MSDADLKVTDRRWWARGDSPSATDETPKLKPTYIEELEARIAAKDAELQQLLAKYRGAADEFEQVRARLRKEVAKDVERGRRAVLGSFLDVLDNLDRAIAAAGDRADDPFVQGVALVRQQFLSTLEGLGVVRVDPIGQMFDPTKHEAVSTSPATDDTPTGQIVGVIRPGYLIGDEALRPAMVAVAG
ncbi:MAG TPA: nucleotide exchange factor GrpE [Vicinamibacterales bacterium]|jgi:molecular chaperone GrpE|nr:nucleotide exchange factor GrpE [Vicinamibacterales bacterium]